MNSAVASRRVGVILVLLVCLAGTAQAGFYRAPTYLRTVSESENGMPAIALSSDRRFVVTPVLGADPDAVGVAAFETATGKRVSFARFGEATYGIVLLRLASGDRVLNIGIGQATLLDLARNGELTVRATVSTSVNGSTPKWVAASAQAGAFFCGDPNQGVVDVFSLDNGQVLSRIDVSPYLGRMAAVDGERPRLLVSRRYALYDPMPPSLLVYDLTDPASPDLIESVVFPPPTQGDFGNEVTSRDGRYAYFSDFTVGPWTFDLRTLTLTRFPDNLPCRSVQVTDLGERRIISLLGHSTRLYDLTRTTQPILIGIIDPPPPGFYSREEAFLPDGTQLVAADSGGLAGYDSSTSEVLWRIPLSDEIVDARGAFVAAYDGDGGVVALWANTGARSLGAVFSVPSIASVETRGRDLIVRGRGCEAGSVVEVDGVEFPTKRVAGSRNTLRVKRAAAAIESGQTATVQVRTPSGTASTRVEYGAE